MGRSLIDTASYDPDTLRMLSPAFDDVWREMVGKFHNRLATIILWPCRRWRARLGAHENLTHGTSPEPSSAQARGSGRLRCALAWGSRGEGPGGFLTASRLHLPVVARRSYAARCLATIE
jgi:hypothetical protein